MPGPHRPFTGARPSHWAPGPRSRNETGAAGPDAPRDDARREIRRPAPGPREARGTAPARIATHDRPLPQAQPVRYLALCARPTEALVAAELRKLPDVADIEPGSGVVSFSGPRAALYRANLLLRCASRVLVRLADFPCDGPDDLYRAARAVPWEDYLSPSGTMAVSAHGLGPGIDNSMFAALRVKDAAADRFRERFGMRPDVDVERPALRINVQLYQGAEQAPGYAPGTRQTRCSLSIDSSEEPLYRRGYRQQAGDAPMKETLAAAILALTGDPTGEDGQPRPVVDLCCGSGTLLIEAGLRATGRVLGRRRRFGFMSWRDFDAALWQRLCDEAARTERPLPAEPFLFGSDIDGRALDHARRNAESAGLSRACRFHRADLRSAEPPRLPPGSPPGIVVCNPPYGERLGEAEALVDLYRALGDTLKRRFQGYTAYVFTGNLALGRQIGLRPSQRHPLWNGNLEARLLRFDLY